MPRQRADSFYLQLHPETLSSLSLSRKAELSRSSDQSTTISLTSQPFSELDLRPRRHAPRPHTHQHVRKTSSDADDEGEPEPSDPVPKCKLERLASIAQIAPNFVFPPPPPQPATPARVFPWTPRTPSPLQRLAKPKLKAPSAIYAASFMNFNASQPAQPAQRRRVHTLLARVLRSEFMSSPAGTSARRLGLRTAWKIDEDIQQAEDELLHFNGFSWLGGLESSYDDDEVQFDEMFEGEEPDTLMEMDAFRFAVVQAEDGQDDKLTSDPDPFARSNQEFQWHITTTTTVTYTSSPEESSTTSGSGSEETHSEFSDDSDTESDSDYGDDTEDEPVGRGTHWEMLVF